VVDPQTGLVLTVIRRSLGLNGASRFKLSAATVLQNASAHYGPARGQPSWRLNLNPVRYSALFNFLHRSGRWRGISSWAQRFGAHMQTRCRSHPLFSVRASGGTRVALGSILSLQRLPKGRSHADRGRLWATVVPSSTPDRSSFNESSCNVTIQEARDRFAQ
jgi:hypothetical protein